MSKLEGRVAVVTGAAVASFVASDEARFVNGTTIFPDGGITAGSYSNTARLATLQMQQGS